MRLRTIIIAICFVVACTIVFSGCFASTKDNMISKNNTDVRKKEQDAPKHWFQKAEFLNAPMPKNALPLYPISKKEGSKISSAITTSPDKGGPELLVAAGRKNEIIDYAENAKIRDFITISHFQSRYWHTNPQYLKNRALDELFFPMEIRKGNSSFDRQKACLVFFEEPNKYSVEIDTVAESGAFLCLLNEYYYDRIKAALITLDTHFSGKPFSYVLVTLDESWVVASCGASLAGVYLGDRYTDFDAPIVWDDSFALEPGAVEVGETMLRKYIWSVVGIHESYVGNG